MRACSFRLILFDDQEVATSQFSATRESARCGIPQSRVRGEAPRMGAGFDQELARSSVIEVPVDWWQVDRPSGLPALGSESAKSAGDLPRAFATGHCRRCPWT